MSERESLSAAVTYGIDFARERLAAKRILALTGAGISTDSGIPDYRGEGRVARHPMTFDIFMGSHEAQVRYWSRSFIGYSRIAEAKPNAGHYALAHAESLGRVFQVITQNVDALHERAGSKHVIDLHGRLDRVICMACSAQFSREAIDLQLTALNPTVSKSEDFEFTPDGDAEVELTAEFQIPSCEKCGGVLKPDVVFFGESVAESVAQQAMQQLDHAEALLVAGTSLTVNSGLRFARRAARANKPVIIVNLGATKADEIATAKIEASTSLVLERLLLD
ncbi:NAD-dependent protein deacetylase [Rhodoluna sp.]|uniref:NAD-dependent protein deacetylase n=1 Tax=Rhodoluna sp. TaxID=1969481 RepID=UPI0025EE9704|nr:NAD-dependent protein deacetylase [Rhodoluna sp.]